MRLSMKLGLVLGLGVLIAGSFALVRATASMSRSDDAASKQTSRVLHAATPPVVTCASLRLVDFGALTELPVSISSAALNGTGAAEQCRVGGWIGQQTQFELRLPTTTWEGRYLQLGCGGTCGSIGFSVSPAGDTQLALTGNTFAVSSTNEGHLSTGGWDVWAAGGKDNPLRVNYGYLANHQLAVLSKAVIGSFYATAPTYSYFQGYSDGGRAAIMEAQRYPDDFDGIIAGAPAIYTQESLTAAFIWRGIQGSKFDAAARQIIANGAMAFCDPADGVTDNQISDPVNCPFDPGTIQCSATLTTNCLTAEQVDAGRKQYRRGHDRQGQAHASRRSAGGIGAVMAVESRGAAVGFGRHIAFKDNPHPIGRGELPVPPKPIATSSRWPRSTTPTTTRSPISAISMPAAARSSSGTASRTARRRKARRSTGIRGSRVKRGASPRRSLRPLVPDSGPVSRRRLHQLQPHDAAEAHGLGGDRNGSGGRDRDRDDSCGPDVSGVRLSGAGALHGERECLRRRELDAPGSGEGAGQPHRLARREGPEDEVGRSGRPPRLLGEHARGVARSGARHHGVLP